MAVGNAFSIVAASKPPISKDKSAGNLETNKFVRFTVTRIKLPGQKTEASICQVTVSKPTITPSFMPFSLFALIALSNVSARTYTAATPYVAGTPNGGNQAAKASPHSFAYPMYLKGESLYMSYSFFSTPFTGATTVSAEEEILEGEEVVISSLSFVNARTPEVLLKVLLDNRCFKFLLLSPWTNLNDAPRDLWWFFLCTLEDVDVDVDEEEKILHLDEEEGDKEDTTVLMEDMADVIVAALMSLRLCAREQSEDFEPPFLD